MPRGKKRVTESEDPLEEPRTGAGMDVDLVGDNTEAVSAQPAAIPSYVVELAKSGRAVCRRCDEKIDNKTIRVGVILDGDYGLYTRWQHLHCTVFHKTITSADPLDGFRELSAADKEAVTQRVIDSQNEVDEDDIPLDPSEMVRKNWEKPLEPSSDLLMPLLPYQKEGLGWMVHQEMCSIHGGILADEMGMGKTIQAISLILQNRPSKGDKDQSDEWDRSDLLHDVKDGASMARAGTLLVLPTVAIRQWQTEIARFTRENCLKVIVYHGNSRSTSIKDITAADVVITSYKIIEIEFRKATAGTKITCSICNKKFYPDKLRIHRKYFCGESAQRTAKQSLTQKKRQRVAGSRSTGSASDESSNEEDSEDEIGKQKRVIKKMKAKGVAKGKKSKKKEVILSESSEDEVSRQKKHIKGMKNQKETKAYSNDKNAKVQASKSKVTRKTEDDESEDEVAKQKKMVKSMKGTQKKKHRNNKGTSSESESEDEISRQKKLIKKLKESKKSTPNNNNNVSKKEQTKGSRIKINVSSDSDDQQVAIGKKSAIRKKAKPLATPPVQRSKPVRRSAQKKVNYLVDSGDEDSDSEEYVVTSSSEEEDDDSNSNISDSSESVAPIKKGKKPAARKAVKSEKTSRKRKAQASSESEDSVRVNSDEDSEVEREIQAALRESAKRAKKNPAPQSITHMVSWFRIILDEAHLIKDRSTSTAKAVFHLVSLNKWCLTGTPLQNRVSELYSLVRFLRIDPHAFYFCKSKNCNCKSLYYRFQKGRCEDCGHSVMQHFCHFNRHILNPIKRSGFIGDGKKAMLKLKQQVLDEILLRRTKTSRADDIQLPPRIVRVRQEKLDEKEEDFYQALYTQSQAQFNTYLQSGTVLNNYAHIFDILIRLRQAVDHPYLVIHSQSQSNRPPAHAFYDPELVVEKSDSRMKTKSSPGTIANVLSPSESVDDLNIQCSLCHEPPEDPTEATCGHCFCRSCIEELLDNSNRNVACPECEKPLTALLNGESDVKDTNTLSVWNPFAKRRKSIIDRMDLSIFQSSTKLEALMEELHKMAQTDLGAKAIVFSQFVNMLDIMEYRIQREGIGCSKLLGSMNLESRDKVITAFKEDPDVKILLISLKAGGVALNLTVASHIFLMDPWWNPAAEMQAIDRTHRIGQHKPIFATRFIIENTIEERILKLQDKKKLVFDGTVGGDSSSMTKLTVDDMRFLFQ